MSTLVDIVRRKSGATEADASDPVIIDALLDARVRLDEAPVTWNTTTRIGRLSIAAYKVEASGATGSVPPLLLHDALGIEVTTCVVDQDGVVTIPDDSDPVVAVYATGSAYDPNRAAATVVEQMMATRKGDFDFKRGDQEFKRSQIAGGAEGGNLGGLLRILRAKSIPRRRGETVMRDQAPIARPARRW